MGEITDKRDTELGRRVFRVMRARDNKNWLDHEDVYDELCYELGYNEAMRAIVEGPDRETA